MCVQCGIKADCCGRITVANGLKLEPENHKKNQDNTNSACVDENKMFSSVHWHSAEVGGSKWIATCTITVHLCHCFQFFFLFPRLLFSQ